MSGEEEKKPADQSSVHINLKVKGQMPPKTRGRGSRPLRANEDEIDYVPMARGRGRDRCRVRGRRTIRAPIRDVHVEIDDDNEVLGEVEYNIPAPPPNPKDTIQAFLKLQPPTYLGENDFFKAEGWLETMEEYFVLMKCGEENQVLYAAHMLRGTALDWWRATKATKFGGMPIISWYLFKEAFQSRYAPMYMRDEKQSEFLYLQQTNLSVAAYHTKFIQLEKYYALPLTEEMRAEKFINGLTPMLRSRAMLGTCPSLEKAVKLATKIENDLQERGLDMRRGGGPPIAPQRRPQMQWGRTDRRDRARPYPQARPQQPQFHPRPQPQRQVPHLPPLPQQERPPQHDRPLCDTCGRYHGGVCWRKIGACIHCGQVGHFVRECPVLRKAKQVMQDKAKKAHPPKMVQERVYNMQAGASTSGCDIVEDAF